MEFNDKQEDVFITAENKCSIFSARLNTYLGYGKVFDDTKRRRNEIKTACRYVTKYSRTKIRSSHSLVYLQRLEQELQ